MPVALLIKFTDFKLLEAFSDWMKALFEHITGPEQFYDDCDGTQKYDIEYFVVNLKETLTSNNNEFMLKLQEASSKDISYLEVEVLQTIIKHKWSTYTQNYYLYQCIYMVVFIVFFVGDLMK